jgi:hypothetical protein
MSQKMQMFYESVVWILEGRLYLLVYPFQIFINLIPNPFKKLF